MNVTADSGIFEERAEAGLGRAVALALAVHLVLGLALFFGVRWQNRPPLSVSVELWSPPPPPVVERVEPPKPAPRVEPPPAPKPEPVIEKPEIELKAPPKPKPEAKPRPRPEPPKLEKAKPEPPKPRVDPMKQRMQEELMREQTALKLDRERAQLQDQLKRDASSARDGKAVAEWVDKVRAKIRGNIVLPPDLKGNPEAVFDVVQLPTGEVLSVRLRRTSGVPALDAAIERAILKSSPLPKPDRPELFQRSFELKYRPQD